MDTGLNVRPVQPVSVAPVRISPPVERQTAASDLPETQAVTAAPVTDPVRFDDQRDGRELRAQLNSAIDRKSDGPPAEPLRRVVQDPATKELVFRKISPDTGQVIGQYPEEALLRLKAYNAQVNRAALVEVKRVLA
jgi:hypothetical protein